MSPKRLKWTGIICLAFSVLIVGLGFFAQIALFGFSVFMHLAITIPVGAAGGMVEPTIISVPRILPMAIFVAELLFAVACVCLFEWRRRVHVEGRCSKPTWTISGVE